jgi:hypothetical protein
VRSTYSLNRAEQLPNRLTWPLPIPRALVLLIALFAFGAAVGWVATRPFAGSSGTGATTNDYVAVVAQLYARDHNLTLARDRLSPIGSPAALVAQAADPNAKLRDPNDLSAIQALAQALDNNNNSNSGNASPAPASPTHGGSSLVGPILAFVLALILGAIVLLRTAGLSVPRFAIPARRARSLDRDEDGPNARRATGPGRAELAPARRPTRDAPPLDIAVEDGLDEAAFAPSASSPDRVQVSGALTRTRPRARRLTFESSYRLGDDPFDEIHPIIDPVSGTLVAACGLNASLKIDQGNDTSGYYVFTAWIQDYVNGEALNAVGLVTRGALQTQRSQIEVWIERGQIDAVLVGERGTATELSASDLKAKVAVLEASVVESASSSYFDALTVRFEVVPAESAGV